MAVESKPARTEQAARVSVVHVSAHHDGEGVNAWVSAKAPAGHKVIGGGADGLVPVAGGLASYPDAKANAWTAYVRPGGVVHAVCLKV